MSQAEANEIDFKIIPAFVRNTITSWNTNRPKNTPKFEELCFVKQTILISRTYNVGPGMPKVMKEFYLAAKNNDWKKARYYLERDNISDPNRIKKELAFLDHGHDKQFKYSL